MTTINIEEAQARLRDIILGLNPGEPVVILQDGEPLALLSRTSRGRWPCRAGSAKQTEHWMADDFDAPLEDFREHVE
jgi:antitoxin (DNA-binding transcriptional repressor) of toxin-antitoxin stability system